MAAVLLYFRADLWRIAKTWFLSLRNPELRSELDARMGWYIGLGTIPIAIFGFVFRDQIESGARSLYLVGTTLIVLGLLLLLAEKVAKHERDISDITARDAALIGFAQALALDPGRLALGRDDHRRPVRRLRPRVGRALLVPALGARGRALRACSRCARSAIEGGAGFVPTALATIAAFIVGYASIAWLLRWLASHSTIVFVVYRVALGALVIALTAAGAIA